MNQNKQGRKVLIGITAAIAVVIAGIVYLSLTADQNPVRPLNDGYDDFRASLQDAKTAFDNSEALFVDVRSSGEFASSRIPDAVSIPLADIAGNEPAVEKGALIYTYCT